jgi:hypothetical protein
MASIPKRPSTEAHATGQGVGGASGTAPDGGESLTIRLQAIEKRIAKAENTVALREKDLEALRPDFESLERECRQAFECSLDGLGDLLAEKEAGLGDLVVGLERDLQHERDLGEGQPSAPDSPPIGMTKQNKSEPR